MGTGVPSTPARAPLWARSLVAVGIVLVLASGLALVGGRFLLMRYTNSVHQENLLGGALATPTPGGVAVDGPINILLVGTDERPGDSVDGARSDSIIILHVTAAHDRAYLVSIPRDSLVDIPADPRTGYGGGQDKINAAYQYGSQNGGGRAGGFSLLASTIEQLAGVTFNGGAIVNFAGFQSLVSALGGVTMCVDEKTTSVHIGTDAKGNVKAPYVITATGAYPVSGVTPVVYQPGCQHLAAWQALDYVRQRELIPDGDYGRQRHQQQFLQAVLKEATSTGVVTNPVKLDAVLRSAGQALTFDGGGVSIANWIFTLKGIGPGNLVLIKTNGGNFNSEQVGGESVEVLNDLSRQLLQSVRDDTVNDFVTAHPDWVAAPAQP
jgi:LCP family protein required for cell wall assembly